MNRQYQDRGRNSRTGTGQDSWTELEVITRETANTRIETEIVGQGQDSRTELEVITREMGNTRIEKEKKKEVT